MAGGEAAQGRAKLLSQGPPACVPTATSSPFPSGSAGARSRREGGRSSGGWRWSQAICSPLPPAWVVAARPQAAPAPLTTRQRALTPSLCVLSSLPDIAARSLSTALLVRPSPLGGVGETCCPLPQPGISTLRRQREHLQGSVPRGARGRLSLMCLQGTGARVIERHWEEVSGDLEVHGRGLGPWGADVVPFLA